MSERARESESERERAIVRERARESEREREGEREREKREIETRIETLGKLFRRAVTRWTTFSKSHLASTQLR